VPWQCAQEADSCAPFIASASAGDGNTAARNTTEHNLI
jgi:hypothetical protein